MKVSEIISFLDGFQRSDCSADGLGCYKDAKIRTTGANNDIVERHYNSILEEIESHDVNDIMFVRSEPRLVEKMDEEGELEGYIMSTRLQFGVPGECITRKQRDNLINKGAISS